MQGSVLGDAKLTLSSSDEDDFMLDGVSWPLSPSPRCIR